MENERKIFADEANSQLKRHKALIDKLSRENEKIKEDLNIALVTTKQSGVINYSGSELKAQASALQATEEIKMIRERLDDEKVLHERMEDDIKTLQQEIIDQKRRFKGLNGTQERNAQITRQLKILEQRLEKANLKFNEAVSDNKHLREQIDALRRERVIFDNVYKRLERDLLGKRQDMSNVIEIANSAYEESDRAKEKLSLMMKRVEIERALEIQQQLNSINDLTIV